MPPNPLPADTVEALRSERDAAHSVIATLEGELRRLRLERDLLQAQLQAATRRLFAAKSESRGSDQRDLFLNEAEALGETAAPAKEAQLDSCHLSA
jgi:predicted  nucleic acid-binding Zn-ribbon protein